MPMLMPGEDPITFGETGLIVAAARVAASVETMVAPPAGVGPVAAPIEAS